MSVEQELAVEPPRHRRQSAAARMAYRPELDGLRAVAVYLVLLFHSGLAVARGGYVGVDLFFVLSGFLITSVLLSDIAASGRIRFGAFYARRVRRLLPPALLVIVVTCVAALLVDSVVERLPLKADAQSALLYVANWRFLSESNDYFATEFAKSPFLHFWSLGIEEQFYIAFPLILLLLVRAGRHRGWIPGAGLVALISLSVAAQLYWAGRDPNHAYYGTDSRIYQLVAGALLAWAMRPRPTHRPAHRATNRAIRLASTATAVALASVALLASNAIPLGPSGRGLAATAAGTLFIAGLSLAPSSRTSRMLSRPVPVYLGQISYSIYLWHWPAIIVLRTLVVVPPIAVAAIAGVTATALAAVSSVLLENPIRRTPVLDRLRWPVVAAGLTAGVAVAVGVVPPLLDSPRRPVVVTAVSQPNHYLAPPASLPVRQRVPYHARVPNLDWKALAGTNGPAHSCGPRAVQQCVVVPGGRPLIVLVGDSHARMLAPALIQLARERGFTLAINAMSSCPWQAQLTNIALPPQDQATCTAERDGWYRDVLPRLHADVVILASYSRDDNAVYAQNLLRTGGSHESLHQLIEDTTNETLARIRQAGARPLILDSIISASFDPLDCLARSTYLRQCTVPFPRQPPISDRFYRAAARAGRAKTFDINRIACPGAPVCSPMIDRIPVWRNFNHYTPELLVHFRNQIWATIVATGVLRGIH